MTVPVPIVLCEGVSPGRPVYLARLGDVCLVCGRNLDAHELRIWTIDGELVDPRERECNAT